MNLDHNAGKISAIRRSLSWSVYATTENDKGVLSSLHFQLCFLLTSKKIANWGSFFCIEAFIIWTALGSLGKL